MSGTETPVGTDTARKKERKAVVQARGLIDLAGRKGRGNEEELRAKDVADELAAKIAYNKEMTARV